MFSKETYIARRKVLKERMGSGLLIFLGNNFTGMNYADNAYRETDLLLRGEEDPKGYSPFYTSVHLIQNLHYSDFSINFALGMYTFKKTGLVEDISRCFQRIGMRYHLPPFKTGQAFVGFGMRAHYFDRSYCLEYSAGITF